eukprot:TRINITY_DN23303_c0_g1_i1.p1 TRINITY_DN23303_c0_g1~~TRINITY_DN23303_c0_g1_i1.p1  ORF type:complete len:773 (+),score=165.46 TRINITY_DN23303_c0_g1_i1:112-2430(+)
MGPPMATCGSFKGGKPGQHFGKGRDSGCLGQKGKVKHSVASDPSPAAHDNAKTKLNSYLQRALKRPIMKDDFIFAVEERDGLFQAVLTLPTAEGCPEFVGDMAETPKHAEQLAAQQALDAFADDIAALPPSSTQLRKQNEGRKPTASSATWGNGSAGASVPETSFPGKAVGGKGVAAKGKKAGQPFAMVGTPSVPVNSAKDTPKTALNTFLQRVCQRPIAKDDSVYHVEKQHGNWFQAIVTLPCLEGSPQFTGDAASTVKDAEHLAAQRALDAFAEDIAALPPSSTQLRKLGLDAATAEATGIHVEVAGRGKGKVHPGTSVGRAGMQPYSTVKGHYDKSLPSGKGSVAQGRAPAKGWTPLAPANTGAEWTGENPKTVLNTCLQRLCHRPIRKDDAVFAVEEEHAGHFRAYVTLPCLEGSPEFIGEVASTAKEAERLVAQQAMAALADDVAALPHSSRLVQKMGIDAEAAGATGAHVHVEVRAGAKGNGKGKTSPGSSVGWAGAQPYSAGKGPYDKSSSRTTMASLPMGKGAVAKGNAFAKGGALSAPAKTGAGRPSGHPKTALNTCLQRICRRPTTKDDAIFVVQEEQEGQFRAVVTILCLEGSPEFTGELGSTEKEAEQLAAQQALEALAGEVAARPPKEKKHSTGEGVPQTSLYVPLAGAGATALNAKNKLNTFLQKFCMRPIVKNDFSYAVENHDGQFQATLTLTCLEGCPEFVGSMESTARDAEQSAAQQALDAFADEIAALPPSATQLKRESEHFSEREAKKQRFRY